MKDRVFIKGFDKNLKCRGYQFEIGKEFKIDLPEGYKLTANDLCSNKVFHFCDGLSKIHDFYPCDDDTNRFCIIEVLGQFCEDDEKCGSNHIRIVREITGEELMIAKGLTNGNTGLFNSGYRNSGYLNSGDLNSGYRNSGYRNSGDRNSGDRNSGDLNSGDRNSGYLNSGYRNSGYRNSGYLNSGYRNSGDRNSGDLNSGYRNSGDRNSGYLNSGYRNSGYRNSGDRNSGVFNKTNGSNGVFCNKEPKICIFNIQTDWTLSEFYKSRFYDAICSSDFPLTEWKNKADAGENGVDGELIVNTYEDACRRWWDGMSADNKAIIKSIPNFDIDVFCDITGIDPKNV